MAGTPTTVDARRDFPDNDGARTDAGAIADLDVAEHDRMGADQHAIADLGVAVFIGLAGAAERDALKDGAIVADDRGLADDEAGGVIEHHALADPRGGIDVDLEDLARAALEVEREILAAGVPQRMCEAVRLDGLEALEVEEGHDDAVGRGSRSRVAARSARASAPISGRMASASWKAWRMRSAETSAWSRRSASRCASAASKVS